MPFSIASKHWFTPPEVAQRDVDSLSEEFDAYLARLGSARPQVRPEGRRRVVYVTGGTWSGDGFVLTLALAKRSHLLIDLLEILPRREHVHHRSPELFALAVAGLPFEHHERVGTLAEGLLVHLMERDDVVAVVVDYPDLHRAGLVHLQEALLPVISDSGLPTVFLVSDEVG